MSRIGAQELRFGSMKHIRSLALIVLLALSGCRGMTSNEPPVHPNLNMDFQEKYEPQEANPFFADGRAMRPLVPGTVARGTLHENVALTTGRTESGALVRTMPVTLTRELLERGRTRYDIFCAPCHGYVGDGRGIIMTGNYGYVPAPTYHDDRLRSIEDGHFFDVITNGIRNMPSYGYNIGVEDRWAIVAYIRALQRSQHAGEADVPADVLPGIEKLSPNVGLSQ